MSVIFQSGYTLPSGDEPLTHARIAHYNNWLKSGTAVASGTDPDFLASAPNNILTYEFWKPDALPATWEYNHLSAAECDYCCIGAHYMGTNGNTLQVQYYKEPEELVTNGTFDADADWTKGTGWTIGGGVATKAAGTPSFLFQDIGAVSGKSYEISVEVTRTAGNLDVYLGGDLVLENIVADGTYAFTATCGDAGSEISFGANGTFAGTVDNVSVKRTDPWLDLIPATAITSNMPIFAIFEPVTAQRWRIRLTGGNIPRIGVIKFGKALQMQRAIFGGHSPLDYSRVTTSRTNVSTKGEFLGHTKLRNSLQTTFPWENLTRPWLDANWKSLQLAVEENPFFIAWRPQGYSEVGLCYTTQTPNFTQVGIKNLCSAAISAIARGYE